MEIVISCVILASVLICFGGYGIKHFTNIINKQFQYHMNILKKDTNIYQFSVNFKKALNKGNAQLPIINMKLGGKKCTFLLDTGADSNILDKSFFDSINADNQYELNKDDGIIFGGGFAESVGTTNIPFSYRTSKFEQDFVIVDMSEAFNSINKDTGLSLNGILGDKFFQEYQWIIDFEKMVIWVK